MRQASMLPKRDAKGRVKSAQPSLPYVGQSWLFPVYPLTTAARLHDVCASPCSPALVSLHQSASLSKVIEKHTFCSIAARATEYR